MLRDNNKKRRIVVVGKGGGGIAQVQSDWAQTDNTQVDYIKNKPNVKSEWFGTQAEYDLIDPKDPTTIYYIENANGSVVHNNKTYGIKVKIEESNLDTLNATANGQYTPTSPVDGFDEVNVNVQPNLTTLNATTNDTYTPTSPVQGYSEVTVNVQPNLTTLNATTNDTYTPTSPVQGFDEVVVNVQPNLTTLNATVNGTYTPTSPAQGYSEVVVNVTIPQPAPAEQSYFYIDDASGSTNTISIKKSSSNAPDITVYKSTDKTNWESMGTTSTTAITATIPAYGRLYLKATDSYGWGSDDYNYISATKFIKVGGYLSSLSKGDGYVNDNTVSGAFSRLFAYNGNLVDAGDLIMPTNCTNFRRMFAYSGIATAPALPATTITSECYTEMFAGCNRLTAAPNLPATTLDFQSYYSMFEGCHNLTTAPVISATTMSYNSCARMFYNCTSLVTAPALPATSMADNCYDHMFSGCTALTTPPATLPATSLNESTYSYMFENCKALTTAPVISATSYYAWSCRDMFIGCSSLTTAPVLNATTLGAYACYEMFAGCSSLNSVTAYMQDVSTEGCIDSWLSGVAAQGDFFNLGGATYTADSASGIPSGWTEHTSL